MLCVSCWSMADRWNWDLHGMSCSSRQSQGAANWTMLRETKKWERIRLKGELKPHEIQSSLSRQSVRESGTMFIWLKGRIERREWNRNPAKEVEDKMGSEINGFAFPHIKLLSWSLGNKIVYSGAHLRYAIVLPHLKCTVQYGQSKSALSQFEFELQWNCSEIKLHPSSIDLRGWIWCRNCRDTNSTPC
jgi:hypothetical protein